MMGSIGGSLSVLLHNLSCLMKKTRSRWRVRRVQLIKLNNLHVTTVYLTGRVQQKSMVADKVIERQEKGHARYSY